MPILKLFGHANFVYSAANTVNHASEELNETQNDPKANLEMKSNSNSDESE